MDIFNHLTPETTILTPNRRLAAVITKKYAQHQTEKGLVYWPTLDILPLYPSWLERTWKNYTRVNLQSHPLLLTTSQEQLIWENILRSAPENESLLQITDTAKLAKNAWETLKRWQVNLTDPQLTVTEDSRAFINWAKQFQKFIKTKNCFDQNSLADLLSLKIQQKIICSPKHLILMSFAEIAPQYQSLLDICARHGTVIEYLKMPSRNVTAKHVELTDTETELQNMALWAKSLSDKSESIGCIIPSLETDREIVLRIFSSVFPDKNFNISAGKPLNTYPVIYDALEFLNIKPSTISLKLLSTLLRSPFVGDAEREHYKRTLFLNRIFNSNLTHLSFKQLFDPNSKLSLINNCPTLANRLQQFIQFLLSFQKKLLASHEWVKLLSEGLLLLGWPGERSLNSHEYQVVHNAWFRLLNEYSSSTYVFDKLSYADALRHLKILASNATFQPESPETKIQILGLLEAADIPFDHAWVMGLDDTSWPSRAKPNPFIPLKLQKSLNMPNASAERELNYCRELTQQFQQSTEHIIFSNPLQKDDMDLRSSALIKEYELISIDDIPRIEFQYPSIQIYQTKSLEWIHDKTQPIDSNQEISGGVKIFKTQAECPFKAFAELRLHAKKIEEPSLGLRKLDRGNVIHKALENIWKEIQNSQNLQMKSDEALRSTIHHHAEKALYETIDPHYHQNKRYLQLELQRLEKILLEWLQVEKLRPPFNVVAVEQEVNATVGKIKTHFRVDRIDEIPSENTYKQLIIDYKTGQYINRNDWFGERLAEPQLPLYCLINPDVTLGIAFAIVNPNKMYLTGTSRYPLAMESLSPVVNLSQADATLWNEQMNLWKTHLEQLADDFIQGKASVNPKDPQINCRNCGLQAFCRVHETVESIKNDD